MEIDNSFEVPVAVPEAWALLMDIERIVVCVPGAELTETIDADTFKGKIAVRLGPVNLTFAGQAHFEQRDDATHTAIIKAQGTDSRGRGGAQANVTFRAEAAETAGASKILIHTDLQLSGAVAQYGRGAGMVADLAQHLIDQFAECLKTRILSPAAADGQGGEAPAPGPAAPLQVGGLGLKVLWNALLRGLKRLFGGG